MEEGQVHLSTVTRADQQVAQGRESLNMLHMLLKVEVFLLLMGQVQQPGHASHRQLEPHVARSSQLAPAHITCTSHEHERGNGWEGQAGMSGGCTSFSTGSKVRWAAEAASRAWTAESAVVSTICYMEDTMQG